MDVYHKWLSIPPGEQPPNHYRLLGLARFERDSEVIANAAARHTAYVRTHRDGPHSAEAERLLSELAAAERCLSDPNDKYAYDTRLRDQLAREAPEWSAAWTLAMLTGAARCYALWARRLWHCQTQVEPAYWRLGVEEFHSGRHRQQVADDALYERIASLTAAPPVGPAAPAAKPSAKSPVEPPPVASPPAPRRFGWFRTAWRFVAGLCRGLWRRWRQVRRNRLLAHLGHEVYRRAGAEAGPTDLIDAIHEAQARLDDLDRRLAALGERKPGRRMSPRRMAWLLAAAAMGVLLLFYVVLRLIL